MPELARFSAEQALIGHPTLLGNRVLLAEQCDASGAYLYINTGLEERRDETGQFVACCKLQWHLSYIFGNLCLPHSYQKS